MVNKSGYQNKCRRLSETMDGVDQNYAPNCISQLLINREPGDAFPDQCGVTKSDPLPPYLFILIAHALKQVCQRVKDLPLFVGPEINLL
jgi:hypothetical protein